MGKPWKHRRGDCVIILLFCLLHLPLSSATCSSIKMNQNISSIDKELGAYIDDMLNVEKLKVLPGIVIEKISNASSPNGSSCSSRRSFPGVEQYFVEKFKLFRDTHLIKVNFPETARFFFKAVDTGKSSFMTGFGMGFLAFGLKKLLLPVFIGAQIVKSILIAMFLPSILGSLGKIVGKGLSSFSGAAASGGNGYNNQIEDFEFKDTSPFTNEDGQDQYAAHETANLNVNSIETVNTAQATNSRIGYGNQRISYVNQISDNYYVRQPNKKTDYKVFHKIPSSSLLLTSYDPFYSPLLSRLDSVFQQLGLGDTKSPDTEYCRERLVCLMYANPAKYAPYSNLVSAQLSRELNELRKPASDNPDILRFFRYMKAARDGQDGEECAAHGGCPSLTSKQPSPAMLTTFNDINKLVQARKLNK